MNGVMNAVMLTAVAGLSTGIGGATVFFSKKMNTRFLSFTLGISAGVMIYISFAELFVKASNGLAEIYGAKQGAILNAAAFFGGIALVALIGWLIPEDGIGKKENQRSGLMHTGVVTAIALAVHNFPEGMATFVSALQSPNLAIPIVVAIAIHNIPEGVAVAVPIFYASGSRKKAFFYSLLSGLTEPLGAVIGYLVLMPFMSEVVEYIVFSAVAGIMVFISVDELLPSAREYGEHGLSILGVVVGMVVMAVSLIGFL